MCSERAVRYIPPPGHADRCAVRGAASQDRMQPAEEGAKGPHAGSTLLGGPTEADRETRTG